MTQTESIDEFLGEAFKMAGLGIKRSDFVHEMRRPLSSLIQQAEEKAVNNALDQLKAPDSLLEAHKKYSSLANVFGTFEYLGKTYTNCHICGFSPEAMNDEIDRIKTLSKEEK